MAFRSVSSSWLRHPMIGCSCSRGRPIRGPPVGTSDGRHAGIALLRILRSRQSRIKLSLRAHGACVALLILPGCGTAILSEAVQFTRLAGICFRDCEHDD